MFFVVEVDAIKSSALVTQGNTDPQIIFHSNEVIAMLKNEIGVTYQQLPLSTKTRNKKNAPRHKKLKCPKNCGKWDHVKGTWKNTRIDYKRLLCPLRHELTQLIYSCNLAVPICHDYFENYFNDCSMSF